MLDRVTGIVTALLRRRRSWVWVLSAWLSGVVGLVCPLTATAQSRALLLIANPEDHELLGRMRGQLSDLPVTLIADEVSPHAAALPDQLRRARARLEAKAANIVVWCTREDPTLTVWVADPANERLLSRRIERSSDKFARSAQQETAALVVRTALRSHLEGNEIGVPEQDLVRESESKPALPQVEAAATRPEPTRVAEPSAAPAESEWHIGPYVGGLLLWNGGGEHASYAIRARMVGEWRSLRLEVRGTLGFAGSLSGELAALELTRRAVSAHAGWVALAREQIQLALALGGGVAFYRSQVAETRGSNELQGQSDQTSAGFMAADLTFGYLPRWGQGRFGLAASTGLELYARALELGYYDESLRFVRDKQLWRIQPNLALELFLRW